jgi:hypothetical protein
VEGNSNEEIFEVVNVKQLIGGLNLVSVANGSKENLRYIVEQRDRAAHLILQVSAPVKGKPFTILNREPKQPNLFADFPLIGSHDFIFPCVVNSHFFWPNEERSSVILA